MAIHMIREIDKLKKLMLSLAALTEDNVRRSVQAVVHRDRKLAVQAIEADQEVDRTEVEVEEECLKILALYQPVAHDLRFIIAMLKINHDLERIDDLAVNIAQRAHAMADLPALPRSFDVQALAEKAQGMVARSLDALINRDADLARKLWLSDDEVDEMTARLLTELETEARQRPDHMTALLSMIAVARTLERIADHATNIAKDIIYMIEGDIVRHRSRYYREQMMNKDDGDAQSPAPAR